MKNKKTIFNLGFLLILGIVITVVGVFMYAFIYEVIGQYGITTIYNVSNDLYNQSMFSSDINNYISDKYVKYYSLNIVPDYITIFLLGSFYLYALAVAIVSRKQRNVEFFSNLTIINMVLLLIMSIISQVLTWFWKEFFIDVMYNLHYSVSITEFVINYSSEIFFFMFISLIFINKIEFFGRKKKETYEFEDLERDLAEEEVGI